MDSGKKDRGVSDFKLYYDIVNKSRDRYLSKVSNRTFKSITEKIDEEEREKKLQNDDREQDTQLKKYTLYILFGFLAFETIAIFTIAFFQGFRFREFNIEDWSFRVLVVSTILQITAMLTIAVQHLFPNKSKKDN